MCIKPIVYQCVVTNVVSFIAYASCICTEAKQDTTRLDMAPKDLLHIDLSTSFATDAWVSAQATLFGHSAQILPKRTKQRQSSVLDSSQRSLTQWLFQVLDLQVWILQYATHVRGIHYASVLSKGGGEILSHPRQAFASFDYLKVAVFKQICEPGLHPTDD